MQLFSRFYWNKWKRLEKIHGPPMPIKCWMAHIFLLKKKEHSQTILSQFPVLIRLRFNTKIMLFSRCCGWNRNQANFRIFHEHSQNMKFVIEFQRHNHSKCEPFSTSIWWQVWHEQEFYLSFLCNFKWTLRLKKRVQTYAYRV